MARRIQLFSVLALWLAVAHVNCADIVIVDAEPVRGLAVESNSVDDTMNSSFSASSLLGKNLNEVVDVVIGFTQEIIKKSGRAIIQVPDIDEEFTKKVHFIKIKGKFTAENGWFKDLSSIHRTDDATMTHSGGNITVSVPLGLQTLQLGYDHYRVKVEHLPGVSGKLTADAASNSVLVKVNVLMLETGKCNLTLQELKITKLDGLQVHVEGKIKPVAWVLSKIVTSVLGHMKDKVIQQVEQRMSEAVQKALDKYHC